MKKDESGNIIKSIAEYLMAGLLLVYMILCTPLISHAECVTVNNVHNRITDGELCYEILDKNALTVQVGYGKDTEPSASATGLRNKEITDLVIPDTVEYQGDTYRVVKISCYAFYQCTNLNSITIGENIEDISVGAFKGCSNVSEILWNAKHVNDFAASNELGNGNVFSDVGSNVEGITLTFGGSVERIPARAFFTNASSHQYCDKIKTIHFGDNIRSIGEYAFSSSSLLEQVILPQKLETISDFCFEKCTDLRKIIISDTVQNIGKRAFYGCEACESLVIGAGVTVIGNDAFSGCKNISVINWNAEAPVDFSDSNGIFYNAGVDAENGIQVIFGPMVKCIPANLFFPKAAATAKEYINVTNITFQNDEASEVTIGANAFRNCMGLTEVELKENVVFIGQNAFKGCTGITKLYWNAEMVQDFESGNGVFENLGSDGTGATLYIGGQVRRLPAYAFAASETLFAKNCNIQRIVCDENLVNIEIGAYAFRACTGITEYDWRGAVTAIGDYAFYACTSLEQLLLTGNEKTIGKQAFSDCSKITLIELGAQVQSVGTGAFNGIGRTTQVSCYNRSSAELEKGKTYNGSYFSVYSPLEIISEHGEYTLQGGAAVDYQGMEYYKAGDPLVVRVVPDSSLEDAWDIDYASCNGSIYGHENSRFNFNMPGSAAKFVIRYKNRTDLYTAAVGGKGYESLQAAVDAAADGDKIELLKNTALLQAVLIDKSLVIEGNGYRISRDKNVNMLKITDGEVSIGNITWDGNQKSGAILNVSGGSLTLKKDCIIRNNVTTEERAALGYGSVYIQGGTVLLHGGQIMNNQSVNGAGIYLAAGELVVAEGTICDNEAMGSGGGIYVKSGAAFTLQGGDISGNSCSAAGYGAGIYLEADQVYVSGSPVVKGNYKDAAEQNLYLPTVNQRLIFMDSLQGAGIGISLAKPPSVTLADNEPIYINRQLTEGAANGYEEGSIYSDRIDYDVRVLEDGELYMVRPVYQVTFDANGGFWENAGTRLDKKTVYAKRGESLRTLFVQVGEPTLGDGADLDKQFSGWYDAEGHQIPKNGVATGDVVYFARWAKGICKMPIIDIESGTYKNPVTVTITAEDDSTIYYTLDGTIPTADADKYQEPIRLEEDSILQAVCMKEDYGDSEIVTREYKIRNVESVKILAPDKVYKGDEVQLSASVVTGNQSTSKELVWSLADTDNQTGTNITPKGLLSVAQKESKDSITVCAVSVEDETKHDTVTIPVAEKVEGKVTAVYIVKHSEPLMPITELDIIRGESIALDVKLDGTGDYTEDVIWSLDNRKTSSNTQITDGLLTIGKDEKADCLTVRATSRFAPDKNAVLSVTIHAPKYSVSFLGNESSVDNGTERVKGNMLPLYLEENEIIKVPECTYTCEGYEFVGWNTAADGSGTVYMPGDRLEVKDNVFLYARWTELSSEITGVTIARASAADVWLTEDEVVCGENIAYVAQVSGIGRFDQNVVWSLVGSHAESTNISDEGVLTVAEDEKAEAVTVMAVAVGNSEKKASVIVTIREDGGEKPEIHTIKFSSNKERVAGKAEITGQMESVKRESASVYNVPDCGYVCKGGIFTGWNTMPDGTGTSYQPGSSFVVAADVTLYAQWKLSSEIPPKEQPPADSDISGGTVGGPLDGIVKPTQYAKSVGTIIPDKATQSIVRVTNSGNTIGGIVEGAEVTYVKPSASQAVIKIPDTVTIEGVVYQVTSISNNALKKNKTVTTVEIGANIKKIGISAFEGCVKLQQVRIGADVEVIEKNAFKGCKKLKKIIMGENVIIIGDSAFEKCTALKQIVIPSKVERIGKRVFYGDKKLKTLTFKSCVLKKVGSKALKGIHKKAVIKVPKKMKKKYKKLLKGKGQLSTVKIK